MKVTKIASVAAASLLALTLMACTTSSSSYEQYTLDEVSGIKVEAENAGSDSEAVTESGIEVKEGDVIVISPVTDKGSFHLTITSDADKSVIYDEDVEGRVLYTVAAKPGTYTVTTNGNNVTGWMTVFAQSQDELAAQDASLDEALEEAGLDAQATEDAGK